MPDPAFDTTTGTLYNNVTTTGTATGACWIACDVDRLRIGSPRRFRPPGAEQEAVVVEGVGGDPWPDTTPASTPLLKVLQRREVPAQAVQRLELEKRNPARGEGEKDARRNLQ